MVVGCGLSTLGGWDGPVTCNEFVGGVGVEVTGCNMEKVGCTLHHHGSGMLRVSSAIHILCRISVDPKCRPYSSSGSGTVALSKNG